MSARRGAAIAPPSTLDDEHLPRLDDGKSAATKAKAVKPSEDSPLSPHMQKLQELRGRLVCVSPWICSSTLSAHSNRAIAKM